MARLASFLEVLSMLWCRQSHLRHKENILLGTDRQGRAGYTCSVCGRKYAYPFLSPRMDPPNVWRQRG